MHSGSGDAVVGCKKGGGGIGKGWYTYKALIKH